MTIMIKGLRLAAFAVLSSMLASCGGGGGSSRGGSTTTPPAPPPAAPPTSPPAPPPLPTADPASGFTFDFRLYVEEFLPDALPKIYEKVARGDFNGDGRDDLVAVLQLNEVRVFLQRGDGTFAAPLVYSEPITYNTIKTLALGDFNNDGIDDIVFDTLGANGEMGGLAMFLSEGTRGKPPVLRQVFPATATMSGQAASSWTAMDADGDGNTDIVALHTWKINDTEFNCVNNAVCLHLAIYPGDGHGHLGAPYRVKLSGLPDLQIQDPVIEDVDGDGTRDLVFMSIGGYPERDILFYARREAAGGFATPRLLLDLGGVDAPPFFGDLNGDGRRDLIHGNAIFYRNPDGSFRVPVGLRLRDFMESYWNVLDDFDGDGSIDVVNHQFEDTEVPSIPYFVTYLQRNGQMQPPFYLYDPPLSHLVDTNEWSRQAVASGDFNGDGCRDIAVAARYSGILFLEGRNCRIKAR